jgi:hypothetical protein
VTEQPTIRPGFTSGLTKSNLYRLLVRLDHGAYAVMQAGTYRDRPVGQNWRSDEAREMWQEQHDLYGEVLAAYRARAREADERRFGRAC